jgi:hypothetical protein
MRRPALTMAALAAELPAMGPTAATAVAVHALAHAGVLVVVAPAAAGDTVCDMASDDLGCSRTVTAPARPRPWGPTLHALQAVVASAAMGVEPKAAQLPRRRPPPPVVPPLESLLDELGCSPLGRPPSAATLAATQPITTPCAGPGATFRPLRLYLAADGLLRFAEIFARASL